MIVIEASVAVTAFTTTGRLQERARELLETTLKAIVPAHFDAEAASALRRHWLRNTLSDNGFVTALGSVASAPAHRVAVAPLLGRAAAFRANATMCDALYVALAATLDATLVTLDASLARMATSHCRVELLE